MPNTLFKERDIRIKSFEYKDGFMLDVVRKENNSWEIWLYNEKYGIKDFMIALPVQENLTTAEQVLMLLNADALNQEIALYIEEHMQEGFWQI